MLAAAWLTHVLRARSRKEGTGPQQNSAPLTPIRADGGHGSDSTKWVKWRPTPEVIEIRRRYKDLIWLETDESRIRELLHAYWAEEQRAFGEDGWNQAAEQAFFRAVNRVKDRQAAIRVIESVQANKY
jgi:hypothetical protein